MAALLHCHSGVVQTMPNYNVMGFMKASLEAGVRFLATSMGPKGHRVNAISAGPIRTFAASGIKDFRSMLNYNASRTPLAAIQPLKKLAIQLRF